MKIQHFPLTDNERKMVIEVMHQVRKQKYTPQDLCDIQNIIDTQYYYWWLNDVHLEEDAKNIFSGTFEGYFTSVGHYQDTVEDWIRSAKAANSTKCTCHMGHQPLIWLMNPTFARGLFMFESYFTGLNCTTAPLERFIIYVNDFKKHADGLWYICAYRLFNFRLITNDTPSIGVETT